MLTQEFMKMRILGKSEMVELPTNSLVIATGNNITFEGDMTRRVITCRINANEERPDTRQFSFDPRDMAREKRTDYVIAGLTILRAYIIAGRTAPLPKMGSFEKWSVVREALVWLGCEDPEVTRLKVLQDDPQKFQLAELLNLWYECFPDRNITLKDLYTEATSDSSSEKQFQLVRLLTELTYKNQFSAQSIGSKLRSYVGRHVDGKVLLKTSDNNAAWWKVAKSESLSKKDDEQLDLR